MKPTAIAARLIAKHGTSFAYGLCRGRVVLALRRKRDVALYLWHRVGILVERVGNAEGWS